MDLYSLGLLDTVRAYREGRATVQDYVASCSQRISALEPRIQAWEWFDPSRAMAEAEERAGGILGDLPLFGIPVGVKDIIATRGIPTRYGSRIFATNVPVTSAWIVRRLEALRGLVMGKTVTTEFAYRQPGKTRNPWNTAFSPGGSSSGSAAAVAAGFVPIAIGTQTLGSVIRPAAFCGVVGYKPSVGAISRTGIHPISSTLDTVGLFARSVADASWFGACLMGPDPRDEATLVKGPEKILRVPRELRRAPPRPAVIRTSKRNLAPEPQKANFEPPEDLAITVEAGFAQLWTQAGMPSITIPSGFGPRGLPLGLQVVGRYREDQAALEAAAWIEATLGFKPGLAGG